MSMQTLLHWLPGSPGILKVVAGIAVLTALFKVFDGRLKGLPLNFLFGSKN
ncbi:hypothetical protein AMECASPLE_034294 [Ameca splendens]|uniref:Uncharacterized protein n=1 Tax=Ameca splendens TaxID=208324 RepID=A0ABV1AFM5_9TELE